jgi:hypothetical protein
MSILGRFIKYPAEKDSYSIEYADDLVGTDTLVSAVASVSPEGLTIGSTLLVGTRVKLMIEGGAAVGTKHKVRVTATAESGRVMQDAFIISIKDI